MECYFEQKIEKENWDNITKDNDYRFVILYKIGGKKELIKELKELGFTYSDVVQALIEREQHVAKYKNTYFWYS